jgi:hypothetical protein
MALASRVQLVQSGPTERASVSKTQCGQVAVSTSLDVQLASNRAMILLLGYFEGIDSERGIAWRAAVFLLGA